MLNQRLRAFVRVSFLIGFVLPILWASHAQSFPDVFEIVNLNASADKCEYLREGIIRINYSLNCTGGQGTENRYLILALNDSFNFVDSLGYKPYIKYPSGVSPKSANYTFENERGFNMLKVFLYAVNNESNLIHETKITCNLSPTLRCKINRTYDFADSSFIRLIPECSKRGSCEVEIINKVPEVLDICGMANENSCNYLVRFNIADNDSHNLNWAFYDNEARIIGNTGSLSGDPPLFKSGDLAFNISQVRPQTAYLRLHIWDGDGGEDWAKISNPFGNDEIVYIYFAFFVVLVLFLLFLINHRAKPNKGAAISSVLSIFIIIIFIYFKYSFIFLLFSILITSIVANYVLSSLFIIWDEIPGESSKKVIKFLEQKFELDWVKHATIEKFKKDQIIRFSTNENSLILKLTDEKIVKLDFGDGDIHELDMLDNKFKILMLSFIWMALVVGIIIYYSNKSCMQTAVNLNFMTIFLASFAPAILINLKNYENLYEKLVIVLCIVWIWCIKSIFENIYIKTSNDFIDVFIPAVISLIFLPAHIYLYTEMVKRGWKKM